MSSKYSQQVSLKTKPELHSKAFNAQSMVGENNNKRLKRQSKRRNNWNKNKACQKNKMNSFCLNRKFSSKIKTIQGKLNVFEVAFDLIRKCKTKNYFCSF